MRQAVAHTLYKGEGMSLELNKNQGPSPEAWEIAYGFIIQHILPRMIQREVAAGRLVPTQKVLELKT